MRGCCAILLALSACSGPPLREIPHLEEPPALAPPDEKPSERAQPAAGPAESPAPPRLPGAWRSLRIEGPGSAAFRRIEFLFGEDGDYVGIALGPKGPTVISGVFEVKGDQLFLQGADGKRRVWAVLLDRDRLTLRESSSVVVLERIR